jgi:hypothetical protein
LKNTRTEIMWYVTAATTSIIIIFFIILIMNIKVNRIVLF